MGMVLPYFKSVSSNQKGHFSSSLGFCFSTLNNGLEEHKKKVEKDLLQLRNKVCLAFLLMNALFVTIVYTLTEVNKQEHGTLSVKIPCQTNSDSGYGQGHIEPISFAFTAVFGIMLFVQFVCMLFHRYSTLLHVISSSEINFKKKAFCNFEKFLRKFLLNVLRVI
jgi:chitin synthase